MIGCLINVYSCFLTSVRLESLERHGLLVVVIFILPHVVTATCAGLAPVVEVGHFKSISRTLTAENTCNQSSKDAACMNNVNASIKFTNHSPPGVWYRSALLKTSPQPQFGNSSDVMVVFRNLTTCQRGDIAQGCPSLNRYAKTIHPRVRARQRAAQCASPSSSINCTVGSLTPWYWAHAAMKKEKKERLISPVRVRRGGMLLHTWWVVLVGKVKKKVHVNVFQWKSLKD